MLSAVGGFTVGRRDRTALLLMKGQQSSRWLSTSDMVTILIFIIDCVFGSLQ